MTVHVVSFETTDEWYVTGVYATSAAAIAAVPEGVRWIHEEDRSTAIAGTGQSPDGHPNRTGSYVLREWGVES